MALQSNLEKMQKALADFGFAKFRGLQCEVLTSLLNGQSTLALFPTGLGKSLCFQLPAKLEEGQLVLVLSPLVALMQDQVQKARALGVRADFINSSLQKDERLKRYERLSRQQYQLLFVTPERFRKDDFKEALSKNKIAMLVVDEAHCVSLWGSDFRPDYSRLPEIQKYLGNPLTLALTATATPEVQKDLTQQLGLSAVHRMNSIRPNLKLEVLSVVGLDEKIRALAMFRHHTPGPAIAYFSLVQTLEKASEELRKLRIPHVTYHGQLPAGERRRRQEQFISGEVDLILATPAFGLGVDKPDVRSIMHFETPGSLEAYYQEVGRAGRDGLPAIGVLFFDEDDVTIQMDFVKWANPEPEFVRQVLRLLQDRKSEVRQGGLDFLRDQLHFYHSRDFRLETALKWLDLWGVTEGNIPDYEVVGEIPEGQWTNQAYEERKKSLSMKLLQITQWAKREAGCRVQEIVQYLGDPAEPCGHCDLCLRAQEKVLGDEDP